MSSTAINIWKEDCNSVDFIVDEALVAKVAGLLHEKDIPFIVTNTNINLKQHDQQRPANNDNVNLKKQHKKPCKVEPSGPQLWTVNYTNDGQKCFLRSLDDNGTITIWKEDCTSVDFFVEEALVSKVAGLLHEKKIPFFVTNTNNDNLNKQHKKPLPCKVEPSGPQLWTVNYTSDGQKCFLRSLDDNGTIKIWKEDCTSVDFVVDEALVSEVAGLLHEKKIPFFVTNTNNDYLNKHHKKPCKVEPSGPHLWTVNYTSDGQKCFLRSLDDNGTITIWKEDCTSVDFVVEEALVTKVAGLLHEKKIPFFVTNTNNDNLNKQHKKPLPCKVEPSAPQLWTVNYTNDGQKCFLRTLDKNGTITIWKEDCTSVDFVVEEALVTKVAGLLREKKIPFFVTNTNNDNLNKHHRKPLPCKEPAPQLWTVKFTDDGQKCFLRSLDNCGAINIWKEERCSVDFFVDKNRVAQVTAMLHERDIPFSVSINDVDALKKREQGSVNFATANSTEQPRKEKSPCACMNWNNYQSLRTIYTFLDKLADSYPYLCSTCIIGQTCEGRDIKLLKISNGCPDNKAVWLDGGIHAREWISVAVVTYIADELIKNFHKMPECITNKDWYILPVLNPDGYVYTYSSDRMWRKNRNHYGQCVGVDLNRNFSYGWGEAGEEGSSEDPGSIFYRGPKPFSERETIAVKRTILESQNEFLVFLSFHSYGEVIIFPWGYKSDPCPSYVDLLEGATVMARAIHEINGRTYKVGSTKDIMYYSSGTSIDWSYGCAHIPYSYMIELPSKDHRFLLPKEHIIDTANESFRGLVELMQFVDMRSQESNSHTSICSSVCSKL